jgi:type IV secretory pathway TraG/TraD family ATPase VirD4
VSTPTPTARPVGPTRSASNSPLLPWVLPTLGAAVVLLTTAIWVTGTITSRLGTGRWPHVAWSVGLLTSMAGGSHWPWPTQPGTVRIWSAALVAAVAVPAGWAGAAHRLGAPRSDSPLRALGRPGSITHLTLPAARRQAVRLRPTLATTKPQEVPPGAAGLTLGRVYTTGRRPGPHILATWEDVILCVMAPRSGKTTAIAIPAILSAPGPVVATSNKADLLVTAALRATTTGRTPWVFDPQGIAATTQSWWWDPLDGVTDVEAAERLAGHFIATVEDDKGESIWPMSATELLSGLLLAANLSDGAITDVYRWLSDERDPLPATILTTHGFDVLAGSMRSLAAAAPETRASVYFTARSGARCLRNPAITAWVTPKPLARLDPHTFLEQANTLYLMSKDSGGSAAPLVAALADAMMRAGIEASEAAGGRLDPPMVVVLDEAASVSPIRDLPTLYSHLGSRGVIPITILQSKPQGEGVWGERGLNALWSAATIKLIGAGIDDADTAEDISRLIGEHDVAVVTINSGEQGSRSTTLRTQRILTAGQVRALPKGSALLLATGAPATLLKLTPYYHGPHANQIARASTELVNAIREGSQR